MAILAGSGTTVTLTSVKVPEPVLAFKRNPTALNDATLELTPPLSTKEPLRLTVPPMKL